MRPVLHAHCARARVRRTVKTECQIVRERDFKLVGTEIIDVSVRGMLLFADVPILTGEELLVTFKGPTTSRWYDCAGTVARVLHGRRREDRRRAVGVSFEGLGPFHELLLCDELARTPLVSRRRQPKLEQRRGL
jgi:hypothetical protein